MTSEGTRTREKVYIIGHKNPDTDSICSAIAYTELKKAVLERKLADGTFEAENPLQEGMPVPIPEYIACRAGIVNEETKYVLEYFDVEPPQYQDNVQPQIADMDLNLVPGIEGSASIKQAWELMQEEHAKSVPVLAEGKLKGIVTITDIAQSYMDKSDSSVLSRAGTRFASIAETLNGHIVCGGSDEVFEDGKVTIAASSPEVMEQSDRAVGSGHCRQPVRDSLYGHRTGCQMSGDVSGGNSDQDHQKTGRRAGLHHHQHTV